MAINVSLVNYTDQGIRNIKDAPQRARAFRELCKQQGIQVREMLWTTGPYDMVLITEGPEEGLARGAALGREARQRALPSRCAPWTRKPFQRDVWSEVKLSATG